jgi:prolipoprotein diacylglyceryltransferase
VFLVFGRLGCAAAGCCHGRPARIGIVYGPAHVRDGLRPDLRGQALIPVQLFEAVGVAVLTAACAMLVLRRAEPSAALVVYLSGYGIGRWLLELLRDDKRAHWLGSSHTQWTSVAVSVALAPLQASSVVPGHPTHSALAAVLTGATAWRAIRARRPPSKR